MWWRIALSIVAVVYDLAMAALFLTIALNGGNAPQSAAPVQASAQTPQTPQIIMYVVATIMVGGPLVNILAIAFGARLPIGRRSPETSIAAEFS